MAFKPYLISNMRVGRVTALDPWLLPKDAFSTLKNAHLRYGVLEKRRGYTQFARMIHTACDTKKDTYPGLPVMGIFNYYRTGSSEKLIAMDTERLNIFNTTTSKFVDVTRIIIHFKPGASQNHTPAVGDVCEGATTKAYGEIENVVIDHGTCPNGNADGWIIFKNGTITGNFQDAENLRDKGTPANIYGDSDGTEFTNVFTGDDSNFFWYQGSAPSWSPKGYFTNNKDQVQRYDGTVQTSTPYQVDLDVEGGPDNDLETCLMIFVVKNRLVFLNTVEKGTRYAGRARWSEVNNPDIVKATSYKDSPIDDEIVSADFIGDELYVAFTKNFMRLTYTGDATEPFKWDTIDDTEGSRATMSTITFSDELITIGATKIIGFDRRMATDISEKIPTFILEMNQNSISYCYGLVLEEEEEIYESYASPDSADALPDNVLVLNYEDHSFATYDFHAHVFGYYNTITDLILDDLADGVSCDDMDFALDDVSMQAGYPITLMGCRDGWLYRLNYGGDDNGSAIKFEAKGGEWNPYTEEGKQVCLGWIDFLVENDGTSFDVDFFVNSRQSSYQTKAVICLDSDSKKRLIWKRVFSGAVGSFHVIDLSNNAKTNRPRIHAIKPWFEPAGDLL